MQSIAFFNNKGGVGKTTLLCNVAAYLALTDKKKVLVVDADPQCNATQLMLSEEEVFKLYDSSSSFTIYSIIHPLSIGKGYAAAITARSVPDYGVDLIPGDPRLALKEDLLSKDWQDAVSGDIRGLRTSYLFTEFLIRCQGYDFVLFDMGPSLGSINRSVLLSCDFFLSPMSIDIFSLKAIENISAAILEWNKRISHGLSQVDKELKHDLPSLRTFDIKFAGYVAQQYIQKTTQGEQRAVASYEKIMRRIPKTIKTFFVDKLKPAKVVGIDYEVGTIPNLYSLIPMSQTAHKPIFSLKAKDGVRGAHFNKVREADAIFRDITKQLLANLKALSRND
ncbi:ParA family protein [Neorhizobium galegae]|uniref:ParA family protein n=1 Tax=Neorhizobium galegae TaxID=399 RepID=UPI001F35D489|nr:ParA family protein [Neorhizobium galegae]UIK08681.1 ParA family protein [Neorhizobium galegae]